MKSNPWTSKQSPLGVHEIADLLGCSRQSVSSWQVRKQFPEPDGVVGRVAKLDYGKENQ